MKPNIAVRILILCFLLGCSLIAKCYGIEKHPQILTDSDISSSQRLLGNNFGSNCSTLITISSDGPACRVQGNVLGTYKMTSTFVMNWPTWFMSFGRGKRRFLYRCPCARGIDWLFGKSNGNNVGCILSSLDKGKSEIK